MTDSHGRTVARMHIWRVPLRCLYIHGSKPGERAFSGPLAFFPSEERVEGKDTGGKGLANGLRSIEDEMAGERGHRFFFVFLLASARVVSRAFSADDERND